jgi:hypothetical protein
MAAPCGGSINICALRATRLDHLGNVAAPPDNSVVTDATLSVAVTPVYADGADVEQRSGCDCVVVSYRSEDIFKRWELVMPQTKMQPVVQEMLLGGTLATGSDGSATVPVGVAYPGPVACGTPRDRVTIEFWTMHIGEGGDEQDATFPWIHHVYQNMSFTLTSQTYEGGTFANPELSGFTRRNLQWGDGPYADGAGIDMPYGGWFYTDDPDLPTASCDFADVTPAS